MPLLKVGGQQQSERDFGMPKVSLAHCLLLIDCLCCIALRRWIAQGQADYQSSPTSMKSVSKPPMRLEPTFVSLASTMMEPASSVVVCTFTDTISGLIYVFFMSSCFFFSPLPPAMGTEAELLLKITKLKKYISKFVIPNS